MDNPRPSPSPEILGLASHSNHAPSTHEPVDSAPAHRLTRSPTPGLFAASFHGQRRDNGHGPFLHRHSVWSEEGTSMAMRMRYEGMNEFNSMDAGGYSQSQSHVPGRLPVSAAPHMDGQQSSNIDLSSMDFNLGGSPLGLHHAFQDMTAATDIDLSSFDVLSSRDESDSAAYGGELTLVESNMALGMSHITPSDSSVGSVESAATSTSQRNRWRRRRMVGSRPRVDDQKSERKHQCTFCTDRFKTKYDWQRHETSVHLSLDQWQCAKFGPVAQESDGTTTCVFCGEAHPDQDHHSKHKYSLCLSRPVEERIFRRKDHLRQHLRIVHNGCSFIKKMEDWFSSIEKVNSRCGFCDESMTTWVQRQKHLARHFKQGADMKDWEGDRGFDEEIDRLVENDMPVFMIGDQRKTMEPFSGSQVSYYVENSEFDFNNFAGDMAMPNQDVVDKMPSGAIAEQMLSFPHSYRQVESVLLAFVKHEIGNGRVPSDDQLKKKTSDIMFGPGNEWDQTWADNPKWLESFKKKAGLISLPLSSGRNAFIGLDIN